MSHIYNPIQHAPNLREFPIGGNFTVSEGNEPLIGIHILADLAELIAVVV